MNGKVIVILLLVMMSCNTKSYLSKFQDSQVKMEYPYWLKNHKNWGIESARDNLSEVKRQIRDEKRDERVSEKIKSINEKITTIKNNNK